MTEPKIQQYDDVHGNRWLNRDDYRTLSLSSLGGALEFYDFVIYVFYATIKMNTATLFQYIIL